MKKSITNSWLKKYAEGGPDDGFTPGPIVTPINEKPNLFFPIFKNPSTNEAQSDFDYEDYYSKADKYLSRPTFKGTSLNAKDIADAAQDFYNKNKYVYPLDLLLTQGQMETKLGKTLKSKNNFFNVGNTDSGAVRNFASPKDSVFNYMDLMYNDYLLKGKKKPEDLLKPKGFVNYAGKRYASASDYETQLANQRSFIQKHISKKNGGDISIPDLTPNKWIMKYDEGGGTCGKGQVKVKDGSGYKCVNINSQEYKDLYEKGIGMFYKFDKSKNDWVAAKADDPNALFITSKDDLPEVTVVGKISKEQKAERLKKLMDTIAPLDVNINTRQPSESTAVDSNRQVKAQIERNQEAIKNWRDQNRQYGSDTLTDLEVLDRINITQTAVKDSANMRMRGLTDKEIQTGSSNVSSTPSWFEGDKLEGRAREKARQEKEDWEKTVDEENRAKAAVDNDAEFVFPDGRRKKFKDMDKSEKSYVYSKAKVRPAGSITDPNDYYSGRNIAEEYNPFSTASRWVANFVEAPEMTEESSSIMPWVGAVADPILTVAPYLIGQPEMNISGALTKKIFNPLKPLQDISKFMGAIEQGEASAYIGKKVSDKVKKEIAAGTNESITENPLATVKESTKPKVASAASNKYGGSTKWINKYKNL